MRTFESRVSIEGAEFEIATDQAALDQVPAPEQNDPEHDRIKGVSETFTRFLHFIVGSPEDAINAARTSTRVLGAVMALTPGMMSRRRLYVIERQTRGQISRVGVNDAAGQFIAEFGIKAPKG